MTRVNLLPLSSLYQWPPSTDLGYGGASNFLPALAARGSLPHRVRYLSNCRASLANMPWRGGGRETTGTLLVIISACLLKP
jgi:hypothetical protein